MKIAVIAASGRSGQAFVHEALAKGHVIRAGIRGENPFKPHDNLTIIECDATNLEQVTKLIDRSEAVVSLIGHVKGSADYVQTDAMKILVRAMDAAGIKRIVSLTGVGVGPKNNRLDFVIKAVGKATTLVGIKRLQDGLAHARVLEASNLEWTVVKVLLLSDGNPGTFSVKARGIVKAPTPRREVARAILQVLEQRSKLREFVIISR